MTARADERGSSKSAAGDAVPGASRTPHTPGTRGTADGAPGAARAHPDSVAGFVGGARRDVHLSAERTAVGFWSGRYPWIVESALKNRTKQFVSDGEAVVLGVDGVADFNALYSRKHDEEVQLYAFDILVMDGDDLRQLPLSLRKTNLARLLARRPDGIFVAPSEIGEIGPDLFRAACTMGLEGLVSKRRVRAYRGGPCKQR